MFKTKANSQLAKILLQMKRRPKWYTAADFNGADKNCIFIGYEAVTRLGDLYRLDLVETIPRHKQLKNGTFVSSYRLMPQTKLKVVDKYLCLIK